jgi:hypothetical protein
MPTQLRVGIAVSLLFTSIFSLGVLLLNPRFVDDGKLGALVLLGLPLFLGATLGPLVDRWLLALARVGSNEDVLRARALLWVAVAGLGAFFVTLALLPPFLGLYGDSEAVRFGGGLLLSLGFAWLAVRIIRDVALRGRIAWIPVLAVLPAVLVVVGGTSWGRGEGKGSKLLILALPGLSWNVAEDLIDRGEMPNLAHLRRSGAWGSLHSVKGMSSPAVWTSIATGKTSDEHGITSFNATADELTARRIWDILEERGWSVGLFGWPVTWPPRPVDGFVVPAVSDMGSDTYPRELRFIRELAMREKTGQDRAWGIYCRFAFLSIRYGASLSTLLEASGELLTDPWRGRELDAAKLFDRRKLRARLSCDYFIGLRRQRPVDFAAFHTNIVHVAQAYFWKYHEPRAFEGISSQEVDRYGDSVHDAYRIVDGFIGRILEETRENDLVVVVSDHGAEALAEPYPRLALRVEPMLERMRLSGAVEATNVAARTYLRMRPGHEGNQDRVRRLFEAARLDRSGLRPFQARVDEWGNVEVAVVSGAAEALDEYVLFQGGRCRVGDVIRPLELQESSKVRETGSLVLAGNGVRLGREFEECSLFDVVPTLLVLTGHDLAADLAGDVIVGALEPALVDRVPGMVATYDAEPLPAN